VLFFLDVDGVCADFNSAAQVVHGKAESPPHCWDYFHTWIPPLSGAEFWAPIVEMGEEFYDFVEPYSWCDELLRIIKTFTSNINLLTATHNSAGGFAGKKRWCDKYLPGLPCIVVDHKVDKSILAGPGRILLDDNNDNVTNFYKAGGQSIMFPQTWNRLSAAADSAESRLYHVQSVLEFLSSRESRFGKVCL
jgi:hypothetical protein